MNSVWYRNDYRDMFERVMPRYLVDEIRPLLLGLDLETVNPDQLTAFDVGANRGFWSAALLMHSGPFIKRLHMFEPMPGNIDTFRENQKLGVYDPFAEKIEFNERAIGDRVEDLTINYDKLKTGYASAATNSAYFNRKAPIPLSNSIVVKAETLDQYASDRGVDRVHLLKIDVEGYELPVLKGAESLFREKRVDSTIFEFGTHQMGRGDYFRDFWDFFDSHGYSMYRLLTLSRPPQPIPKYSIAHEDFSGVRMYMASKKAPQQMPKVALPVGG